MTVVMDSVNNSVATMRERLAADLLAVPQGAVYDMDEALINGTVNPQHTIVTAVPLDISGSGVSKRKH